MARELFGALAVRKGYASESEVDLALEVQKSDPESSTRIGEILVQMGSLTAEKVDAVLADQVPSPPVQPWLKPAPLLLRQRAGAPLRVNGEPITAERLLRTGDRLDAGGAEFEIEGDVRLVPSAAVAPDPVPAQASVTPASPPAQSRPSPLKRVDAVVARLLPSIHNHRKYLVLAMAPGLLALLLPWRLAKETRWVYGLQGPGWPTVLMTALALGVVVFGARGKALRPADRGVVLGATGLALLLSLWKLFAPPDWAMAMGLGLPLALLSAIAGHGAAWACRAEAGPADDTAVGRLMRSVRDMSGRRAKEKGDLMDRRDELLRQLGDAALEAGGVDGPDAASARKAKDEAEAAKKLSGPSARTALKTAEGKLRRALQKLGRRVVDQDLALDGRQLPSGEIRQLDGRIRELG